MPNNLTIDRLANEKFSQFNKKIADYQSLVSNLEDNENTLKDFISKLKSFIEQKLISSFDSLNKNFEFFFKQLSPNGSASIKLNQSSKTKKAEIKVSFDGNLTKQMKELSGGQKTVTALSLIFAMSVESKPPFFYWMKLILLLMLMQESIYQI